MSIVVVVDNWQFLAKEKTLGFGFVPHSFGLAILCSLDACFNQIQISKSYGFCGYGFGTFFQAPLDLVQKLI
jgi:hypothetical protein